MSASKIRPLMSRPSHLRNTHPQLNLRPRKHQPTSETRRPFLTTFTSASSSPPETLTAQRSFPYPTIAIYDIITDISRYPEYLPFCTSVEIQSRSAPDAIQNRTWPQLASLCVGYRGQITESFTSRIYCAPPSPPSSSIAFAAPDAGTRAGVGIVEAIAGSASTSLSDALIRHHLRAPLPPALVPGPADGPLEYLRTRWTTVRREGRAGSGARERTDVDLSIEYRFRNPVFEALARAASGKVAEAMIEAFERRVLESLGSGDSGGDKDR